MATTRDVAGAAGASEGAVSTMLRKGGVEFAPVVYVPPAGRGPGDMQQLEEFKMEDESIVRRRFLGGLAAAQMVASEARASAAGAGQRGVGGGGGARGVPP